MRLRPALMTCVIAAMLVVGARLTTIAIEREASERNDAQRTTVEVIARDAAGLLVLTQDYGLYRSERAARQWNLLHKRLSGALADYAAADAASAEQVGDLQDTARGLPQIFATLRQASQIPASDADGVARREMLTDQLVNETRRVSDGAFELSRNLVESRRRDAVHQRWLAVATQTTLLTLTLVLAGLLLRRVLAPIDRLRSVAKAVEGGDLAARSSLTSRDELGQLSQALDAMTAALQQRDTALRESNRQLERNEAFLERAGQMAGVGGWELDLASGRLSWTAQAHAIHHLPPDAGLDAEAVLRGLMPESGQKLREAMGTAARSGEGWDLELELRAPDGQLRWLHSVGAAESEAGRVVRLVGAVQDVTDSRAAADKLRRALLAADAASAAKSDFLANMSHEIRTPMNAVMGLSFLLERTPLDAAQRDLLAKMNSASRSLLDVINAVLDLSKIEAGEMVLETMPFDPRALLRDIASLFQPQAQAKGVALTLDLDTRVPPLLQGDAARLRQIVSNLVSNAVKFTAEGEVALQLRCADAQARPLQLEIAVQDSGIGIPAEALSRIFTPFTQADSSTSRRYGGTGLGLSIVRQLCELMGGQVGVSSSPGAGTRFVVRLPFEPAQGLAPAARPLSLLLASDDATQRDALQRLCTDLGWQVDTLGSAEALSRGLELKAPDLVLLDHRLLQPVAEAERQVLQARLATRPCVLMSRSAGVGQLRLPADVSALFDAVQAALAGHDAAQPLLYGVDGASAVLRLPGVRVLVADDSPINLEVVRRILEQEGAIVTLAQDGAVAVAQLRAAPTGFDAVLMDVQMPVLDGLAAARSIRTELGLRQLPILALTAGALLSERHRALDAGMNGFISKPFDPAGLVQLLREQVEAAQGRRLPVAARTAEAPTDQAWPALDGIDSDEASQRMQGDVDFYARLLERLLDEFADLMTQPAMEATQAAARLHKLGGSAGLLAARALGKAAQRGEIRARAGEDFSAELAEVAQRLAALAAQARPWLQGRRPATAPTASAPLDAQALARLKQALQAQDLAALDQFKPLAPALRAACGEAGFERLSRALHRLDFAAALEALSPAGAASA
ncbi:signal transduction histidine kinase/CheY-like chemotaxis protein/HAMP domain-containing protein [Pelomonas saccharophila]|uniref:histidine kinase n=1 Tax=Roseateles saccharophilus TaxID=304 RepID=A0ABU1YMJ9_ROSSA|nr:ATP-binding protein [Roseateles saccharophilus]MDR7269231.1 signal transduction histidine kinase/CheY-like chemotaxis protein/HAMP domain-containing protein [Roseateles saccharophilus]